VTSIDIQLDGDRFWPDLEIRRNEDESHTIFDREGRPVLHTAELVGVALLPDAEVRTMAGEIRQVPAVTLRFRLPDGQTAFAQVKVEMLSSIVGALRGRLEYLAEQRAAGRGDA
jgi:hypothetical protein